MKEDITLNAIEARDLTDRIKNAAGDLAEMLWEAHEKKAWDALGYRSWKHYVSSEFRMSQQHALRLLDFVETKHAIDDSENGSVDSEALKIHIHVNPSVKPATERQVAPLAKLPVTERPQVWNAAVESANGHQPTAKQVEQAVKASKPTKEVFRDATGYAIPDKLLPLWNRKAEVNAVLSEISKARCAVKAAHEKADILFQVVSLNGVIVDLNNAYNSVQMAVPYAVCCTCQGMAADKCASCKGRGFISKLHYNQCVPSDLKEVRSKSCVK